MTIFGLDPGYAIVGFGIISSSGQKSTEMRHGVIRTTPDQSHAERLAAIFRSVNTLLEAYTPDATAIEELFFNTNTKTAIQVAQARGVIIAACALKGVPVFEYTPLQVKQAVVGYGRAEKYQVMEMTRILLGMPGVPKPDDAADALAVALCHAQSATSMLAGL